MPRDVSYARHYCKKNSDGTYSCDVTASCRKTFGEKTSVDNIKNHMLKMHGITDPNPTKSNKQRQKENKHFFGLNASDSDTDMFSSSQQSGQDVMDSQVNITPRRPPRAALLRQASGGSSPRGVVRRSTPDPQPVVPQDQPPIGSAFDRAKEIADQGVPYKRVHHQYLAINYSIVRWLVMKMVPFNTCRARHSSEQSSFLDMLTAANPR